LNKKIMKQFRSNFNPTIIVMFLALSMFTYPIFFKIDSVGAPADIENIDWTLVSYGNPNNPKPVLPATPNDITASFSGGSISGSAGCNSYFGSYQILGNSLTITIDGTTLMLCNPPEIMDQESTFISALEAAQSYQLLGNKLKIAYGGGVLTFTTNQLPPLPPFDFGINLLPPTVTVEAGQPANFQISLTYSDIAYSGTTVTIQVAGLGPGMTYQLTAQGGLTIQTLPSTPSGTYPLTIIGSAQGVTHQIGGVIIVEEQPPEFDYSVTVSPQTRTTSLGDVATYTISVSMVSGIPEIVSLTLSGLPANVQYRFSETSGTPAYSSTLTVDTSTMTSAGVYSMIVTATGGGLVKTANAELIVEEQADFTISITPSNIQCVQGESVSITVNINKLTNFDQVISLRASGLPTGATPRFSPESGKPPFSSTLTIDTLESTPTSIYTVTVDASGGGKTHSATVELTIRDQTGTPSSPDSGMEPSGFSGFSFFENPSNLMLIIIAILIVVLIVMLLRRGRTPTQRVAQPSTGYCPGCGAQINPGTAYCTSCGKKVE
jgi:heat shock protein HslJ